jgi:Flp pilus assembly secretin CpaC
MPPATAPSRPAAEVLPSPAPYPSYPNTAPTPRYESDKATHLQQAAKHLRAAGMNDMADQIEKLALIEEKRAQIKKLQAELDQLDQETPREQTVTVHVKVLEVAVGKLRQLGIDFGTTQTFLGQIGPTAYIDPLVSALRDNGFVRVLAEPTLVTVSGRPASIQCGGEFPIVVPQGEGKSSVDYMEFGTRLDCVATVLKSGRVRLELRPRISSLDTSRSVQWGDTSVPAIRSQGIDTALEVEPGQTAVLSGLEAQRTSSDGDSKGSTETTLMIVTATVELGQPAPQAKKTSKSPNRY